MTLIVATKDAVLSDTEITDGTQILHGSKMLMASNKVIACTGSSRACAAMRLIHTEHMDECTFEKYVNVSPGDDIGEATALSYCGDAKRFFLMESSPIGTPLFLPESGFILLGSLAKEAQRIISYHGITPDEPQAIFYHLGFHQFEMSKIIDGVPTEVTLMYTMDEML